MHLVLLLALSSPARASDPINAVLGDASWVATHVSTPEYADEGSRIVTHLRFVHAQLARHVSHLSPEQQHRRGAAIAALERYIARGLFPRRTTDPYSGRRPRFIDDDGVHCAVGYLIAESGAPELARAINAKHEYDYVNDIADPRLLAWAATHGFTIDELAMIQPKYGGRMPPTPEYMKRRLEESTEHLALACPTKRAATTLVTLHVSADKCGSRIATAKDTDPFARCVADHISHQAGDCRDDYIEKPKPYAFDITLKIDTPQAILERYLALADLDTFCTPRPGAIPDRVKIGVATTKKGLVVAVATTPSNREIDRCIEERVRRRLPRFADIPDLRARREYELVSRLATDKFRNDLQMTARSVALGCDTGEQPASTFQLTVSAKRDATDFTIDLDSKDKKLAACVHERLPPVLRSAYSTSREASPGKSESYFRIDADISVTVPIMMNR